MGESVPASFEMPVAGSGILVELMFAHSSEGDADRKSK